MKISKRSLLIMISLMLALTTAALGTVAYMTDQDTVTNNFTVGNVDIFVDEENVDKDVGPDGVTVPDRDQSNDYTLVPGLEQVKDPRVTVRMGSEPCYVRMRVTLNCYADLCTMTGKTGYDVLDMFVDINSDWTLTGDPTTVGDTVSYEFRYMEAVAAPATEDVALQSLFNTFTVPITFTAGNLAKLSNGGFTMTVDGDAVQTDAFADAAAAWAAFDYQVLGKPMVQPEQDGNTINEIADENNTNDGTTIDNTNDDVIEGDSNEADDNTTPDNGAETGDETGDETTGA